MAADLQSLLYKPRLASAPSCRSSLRCFIVDWGCCNQEVRRRLNSPGAFIRRLKLRWGYPQGFPCKHGGISDEAVESLDVLYLQTYGSGLLLKVTFMIQEDAGTQAGANFLTECGDTM